MIDKEAKVSRDLQSIWSVSTSPINPINEFDNLDTLSLKCHKALFFYSLFIFFAKSELRALVYVTYVTPFCQ